MFQEIGAFDAKAKLPELLRAVARGERYTITIRGKAVADLVPSDAATHRDVHSAVASMQAFNRVPGVGAHDMAEMIAEGRR